MRNRHSHSSLSQYRMAEGGRNKRKSTAAAAAAVAVEEEEADESALSLPHDSFIQQYALIARKDDGSVTVSIKGASKAVKNVLAQIMGNHNPVSGQPNRSVRSIISYDFDCTNAAGCHVSNFLPRWTPSH